MYIPCVLNILREKTKKNLDSGRQRCIAHAKYFSLPVVALCVLGGPLIEKALLPYMKLSYRSYISQINYNWIIEDKPVTCAQIGTPA